MRRLILAVILLSLAAAGLAQPPAAPPSPVVPPAAQVPQARDAAPIAGFEPLAAFPPPTQAAVRSVVLGSGWLARVNQANGRFQYGYLPALRQPMDGDDDAMQAAAALPLARTARFTGDERPAVIAGQAVLALLAATKVEADGVRTPRVGVKPVEFAATLARAAYELPKADDKLLVEAERLCAFIRSRVDPSGQIHAADAKLAPEFAADQAAVALQALAASQRARPAAWKAEALARGVAFYHGVFKSAPNPQLAAALVPAAVDVGLQINSPEAAAAAFEMTDWLLGLQYAATDPRFPLRAGGFRGYAKGQPVDAPPTAAETGQYLEAVAAAYQLNRQAADLNRAARYRQAAHDAAGFLTGLQYAEANTRHFENGFRANVLIGGFYLSPADGNLRLDAAAGAVSGLVRFLTCGAER